MKGLSFIQTSLRARFTVSIILMLMPIILLATAGFLSMGVIISALDEIMEEVADEMHPIMQLQSMIQESAMPLHDYVLHGSPTERQRFRLASQKVDRFFEKVLASRFDLPEEMKLIEAAQREWIIFRDQNSDLLNISRPVNNWNALNKMEDLDIRLANIISLLEENHSVILKELNEHRQHSYHVQQMVILLNAGIFVIGLGLAVTAIIILERSIVYPVQVLKEAAHKFGDGDLAIRVHLNKEDELGKLAHAFNTMAEKLAYSQESLKKMATHDALTELYNHREFYLRMKEEIGRSQRYGHIFSILIVDLDNFKEINDTFGHQAGDKALQSIASLLKREARPIDGVARYGGDEFAIVLPETPFTSALHMAERIRGAIANHAIIIYPGEKSHLTASIGVASYPEDGTVESEIVSVADQSLYAAKNGGRNRVCSARSR